MFSYLREFLITNNLNEIIIICNAYRGKLIEYILNNKLTKNFEFALEIQNKGVERELEAIIGACRTVSQSLKDAKSEFLPNIEPQGISSVEIKAYVSMWFS